MVQLAWQIHDNKGALISVKNYIIKPEGYDIPYNGRKNTWYFYSSVSPTRYRFKISFKRVYNRCTNSQFVVGHNVEFDNNIVGCELLRKKWIISYLIFHVWIV